ncbi:hypothetical protein Tco_1036679 [Tanacetum coccineum]
MGGGTTEKKMEVGVTTIQFLGMEISDGKYQPQPHVAQELLKFPNELSSQKMIQYNESYQVPSRKDASDECWGAVLLVQDNNNKRHVCGYKSGTLKHQSSIITPRSKKSLQSNEALRSSIKKKDAPSCTTFEVVKLVLTMEVHKKLLSYVVKSQFKDVPPHSKHLLTMLPWFVPHHQRTRWLTTTGKGTYVLNISVWSKDHLDTYKWIEANGQWLYDNFDHCEVKTSYDDDDARSLWSSDDDEHFKSFKDDPTHPDAR